MARHQYCNHLDGNCSGFYQQVFSTDQDDRFSAYLLCVLPWALLQEHSAVLPPIDQNRRHRLRYEEELEADLTVFAGSLHAMQIRP